MNGDAAKILALLSAKIDMNMLQAKKYYNLIKLE